MNKEKLIEEIYKQIEIAEKANQDAKLANERIYFRAKRDAYVEMLNCINKMVD